jgi:hypothetical protein
VAAFFGRVFNHPASVFTDEMLRPERQDIEVFVDGMDNIVSTQRRVAQMYFDDGSVAQACPPLRALLHIMVEDHYQGNSLDSPQVRGLFRQEALLSSEWYLERLKERQNVERKLWTRHIRYLEKFLKRKTHEDEAARLGISDRLSLAVQALNEVESETHLQKIRGSIGTQPMVRFASTLG